MRVGQRLFLAVLPAVFGLFLVAALGYWGQYARRVPLLVVLVAAIAAVASLLVSWHNAKYVASRIERLAAARGQAPAGARDEIDTIENAVDRLSAEVTSAREEVAQRQSRAAVDREELSDILARVTESAARAIDEVRLPLHILLANRFGELNENQEEMLGAAQTAVDQAAALLGRVHLIAELDRGSLEPRRDPVRIDEVVGAAIPALRAEARGRQIEVIVDLAPALPRVIADRTHFQDAITALLRSAVRRTADGGVVRIGGEPEGRGVRLTVGHGAGDAADVEHAIARRVLVALGGRVEETRDSIRVDMPGVAVPTASRPLPL